MNVTLDNTIVLTERLLQLSVGEAKRAGGTAVCPRSSLVQVVQNCCFSRLAQARSKAIDLGYDGVQQPVMIEGDDVLLGELCANLLENAIKYTPEHGIVTVYLRTDNGAV
ncbi:sensor protein qseC [Enterobacter cancerogenus]|uniref:histidine kinase n=1 Tax=Enterobacter cancerogenus TaxID=69218 RepID=A0A484Z7G2_9ENTR|nr:sensor protein qseC [Enterobacter cancerogenus]